VQDLDIKLTEIPDWNCCGASVGYAEGGELPRIAMNARNFAQAETNLPGQDIVATCAACWLGSRANPRSAWTARRQVHEAETKTALKEAGLQITGRRQ
jgi:heterodisulfide reductase subunit B